MLKGYKENQQLRQNFGPMSASEGVIRAAEHMFSVCLKTDPGIWVELITRLADAVGYIGSSLHNLEIIASGTSFDGAARLNDGTWWDKDNFANGEALMGYILQSDPSTWETGLTGLYQQVSRLQSDGANDDVDSHIGVQDSPWDTVPFAVYGPLQFLTMACMAQANPGLYHETFAFKSTKHALDAYLFLGTMYPSLYAASFFVSLWLNMVGKILSRTHVPGDWTPKAEAEMLPDTNPELFFERYLRDIEGHGGDVFGWTNDNYYDEPYMQAFVKTICPAGGIPVIPEAHRLAQFIANTMQVPPDLERKIRFDFYTGPQDATHIGELDLSPDTTIPIITDAGPDPDIEYTIVDLINILREFDKQRRNLKTFKGLLLQKINMITIGEKDLSDNRAGPKESKLLKEVFMNTIEEFDYHTVSAHLDLYGSGTLDFASSNIWHKSVDMNEFIVTEHNRFDFNEADVVELIYLRLMLVRLFKEVLEDGANDNESEMITLTEIYWKGTSFYNAGKITGDYGTVSNGYDMAGSPVTHAFSNLMTGADSDGAVSKVIRWIDSTLPVTGTYLKIEDSGDIATREPPYTEAATAGDYEYQSHLINRFNSHSKLCTHIDKFVNWILSGYGMRFGGSGGAKAAKDPDPHEEDKHQEVKTTEEVAEPTS
jgi:hypothetical protein